MKTIKGWKFIPSTDGKSLGITVEFDDQPFNGMLVTRVTHTHVNNDNPNHGRAIQSSNEAVFVQSRHGKAAFPNAFLAALAAQIEPATTFPPLIQKGSVSEIKVDSELPVTYQWEISDDPAPIGTFPPPVAVWAAIEGATSNTLDGINIPDGKWVRCVVSNTAGKSITKPAQKVADKK